MHKAINQNVQVNFHYSVCFTRAIFSQDNGLLHDTLCPSPSETSSKVLCIVDEHVANCHPDLVSDIKAYFRTYQDHLHLVCNPLIVAGGEQVKNDSTWIKTVQDAINQYGIDRHSYVIVIGGGAVIDMAGYAAATAHRGVRLVRIPTTVLSQNDSAVGVKNSVNAYGKKNFLGTFAPPYAVINDFDFLTSLEQRDWISGISEAIKVALLKDVVFFEYIEEHASALAHREMEPMEWVIYRCAQLHLEHIATSGDPFELGSSRPLDFGHWAAHKLEQISNYTLRHGEAVAIGIALDSTYSYLIGKLPEQDWQRILSVFGSLDLAIYSPDLEVHLHDTDHPDCVLAGLREFREHLGGQLTIMLLSAIGQGLEVHEIDTAIMVKSVVLLKEYEIRQMEIV